MLHSPDWHEWQQAKFLQLDQYEQQGMFGDPVLATPSMAQFTIVWTYTIKELDGHKKAWATCDDSTHDSAVRVLDYTYANTPNHVRQHVFIALCAGENLLIYGSEVSNAFAEASPPKQGLHLNPDQYFQEWWTQHKG